LYWFHRSTRLQQLKSSSVESVAEDLAEAGVAEQRDLSVARIDPASDLIEGDSAQLWLETRRVHFFDADSGENLLKAEDELAVAGANATA
jgi:multiple sugar transport system ATP-binding protein